MNVELRSVKSHKGAKCRSCYISVCGPAGGDHEFICFECAEVSLDAVQEVINDYRQLQLMRENMTHVRNHFMSPLHGKKLDFIVKFADGRQITRTIDVPKIGGKVRFFNEDEGNGIIVGIFPQLPEFKDSILGSDQAPYTKTRNMTLNVNFGRPPL